MNNTTSSQNVHPVIYAIKILIHKFRQHPEIYPIKYYKKGRRYRRNWKSDLVK
jgi:hypothetical protein